MTSTSSKSEVGRKVRSKGKRICWQSKRWWLTLTNMLRSVFLLRTAVQPRVSWRDVGQDGFDLCIVLRYGCKNVWALTKCAQRNGRGSTIRQTFARRLWLRRSGNTWKHWRWNDTMDVIHCRWVRRFSCIDASSVANVLSWDIGTRTTCNETRHKSLVTRRRSESDGPLIPRSASHLCVGSLLWANDKEDCYMCHTFIILSWLTWFLPAVSSKKQHIYIYICVIMYNYNLHVQFFFVCFSSIFSKMKSINFMCVFFLLSLNSVSSSLLPPSILPLSTHVRPPPLSTHNTMWEVGPSSPLPSHPLWKQQSVLGSIPFLVIVFFCSCFFLSFVLSGTILCADLRVQVPSWFYGFRLSGFRDLGLGFEI